MASLPAVLRLADAFAYLLLPRLRLDDGELPIAILEHIIGLQCLATAALSLDAARRNGKLAAYAATLNVAPARGLQRGINVFGTCLCFIHSSILQVAGKCLMQEGLLQRVERLDFALVDGFKSLCFVLELE